MQNKFFEDIHAYHQKLSKAPDYTKLFTKDPKGKRFESLRGCSGFVDTFFTLDHFEDPYLYETLSVVLGMGETARKDDLDFKKTKDLVEKISSGKLRILNSTKNIHSKLYILQNKTCTRVICGSNNMTKRAKGSFQEEDAMVFDYMNSAHKGHSVYESVNKRLEHFEDNADEFMEDLYAQMAKNKDPAKEKQIIENWLQATDVSSEKISVAEKNEAILSAIASSEGHDEIVRVNPEKINKKTKEILNKNKSLTFKEGNLSVEKKKFLAFNEKTELPIMHIDYKKETIHIGKNSNFVNVVPEEFDPGKVNEALSNCENYINTSVDDSDSDYTDGEMTKNALCEIMLHILSSPFVSEWARIRKNYAVHAVKKGPKQLIVEGPSNNGKSTFAGWALSLVYGSPIEPINISKYTGPQIKNLISNQSLGATVFPLVLDDPKKSFFQAGGPHEYISKTHWETGWHPEINQPQIIYLANEPQLKEWGKTRNELIKLDIYYHDDTKCNVQIIEREFERRNEVFRYFSKAMFSEIKNHTGYESDDLHLARKAVLKLYSIAEREVPIWLTDKPYSKKYDQGKITVRRMLYGGALSTIKKTSNNPLVFSTLGERDFQSMRVFKNALPQNIASKMHGYKKIEILKPKEFWKWAGSPPTLIEKVREKVRERVPFLR